MSQSQQQMRPLLIVHLFAVVGLLLWWGVYFWHHTPARFVYRRSAAIARSTSAAAGPLGSLNPLFAALRAATGDLSCGLVTVALVTIGTRVYARRLQVWLDARTSGEAVSFGTTDLESQALSANVERRMEP